MNNVRDFGAVGDGVTKDTAAIQRAIDAGGVVHFPPGVYLSGTLYLKSGGGLDLSPGAILLASPDREDYNADDFIPQNRFSISEKASGAHFIVGVNLTNVVLRGGGIIDGNRQAFMNTPQPSNPARFQLQEWRPGQMIYFVECEHLTVENLRLNNPAYWSCFFHGCNFVTVSKLHIENDFRTHNADGIDIDCCAYVTVSDCIIHTADDCITLRGNEAPLGKKKPCEYVAVTNCVLSTRCNAFRIGVGNGLVRRCVISNCIIHDTRTGICLISQYTPASRGVTIEDIQFNNIRLDCARAFNIATTPGGIRPDEAERIRRISFSRIRGEVSRSSIIQGSRKGYVGSVSFKDMELIYSPAANIRLEHGENWYGEFLRGDPPAAFFVQNAENISFDDVKFFFSPEDHERLYSVWSVDSETFFSENCVLNKKSEAGF